MRKQTQIADTICLILSVVLVAKMDTTLQQKIIIVSFLVILFYYTSLDEKLLDKTEKKLKCVKFVNAYTTCQFTLTFLILCNFHDKENTLLK